MGAGSLINLHTHTLYSDGDYTPEQIVGAASKGHLTHIAITDHFETSKVRSLRAPKFPEYLDLLRDLGRRYPDVKVLAGVEIDTDPRRCDLDNLPIDLLNQLDLVLFEYVQTDRGTTVEGLEPLLSQLKVPCGLAHNDLEMNFKDLSPPELAEHLRGHGLFVEINTAWPYKRDGVPFYELARDHYAAFRGRVKISVGTDVHHALSEVYSLEMPYRFVRRQGLEDDLLF